MPSQAYFRLRYNYNPETGELTHRMNAPGPTGAKYKSGDKADSRHKPTGYMRVCIGKSTYRTNRVAWVWMTGEDPGRLDVDHKDRNRSNNKWSNLRKGTRAQNIFNRSNKSPLSRINRKGERWMVTFGCPRTGDLYFEYFPTKAEALAARDNWLIGRYGEFAVS